MHDEQPFCHNLTERRRTTVRFLGQQSEVTIDDTWPQAGEMRSLWKGPDRHHSNIIPLFHNHVTQNAVAMFPPPPNPVISVEHGCQDSRLSAVPHTEDAEDKGRRVVLGVSELSNVYSSHHYDPSGTTESQDAAAEAADPSCQRQDTSEGMSTPPGQALGKWHGKGKYVSTVRGHHQRQGRDHWNQQVGPEETGDRGEEKHHSIWTVEGCTKLDLVQDEVHEAKRLLEEGPCGSPSSPEQSNRSSIPCGTSNGGDGTDQETVGGELGTSRSMRTGQKKRLLGGIKRTKSHVV